MKHNNPTLSSADNSRLDALTSAHDDILAADRAFFDKHPWRMHRLRRMSAPEIEISTILRGADSVRPPNGYVLFVAVKRITREVRFRAFGAIVPHGGDELPEEICRKHFESWTSDQPALRALAKMLAALHAEGRLP